jgi:hypothetical protein
MSNYIYKGCFNDTGNRALPNRRGNVSSVEECKNRAISGGDSIFGVQYYGECWTGNDYNRAIRYGQNYGNCGNLGTSWNNKIYVNGPPSSINGYNYKGCYNDNSTRMIPNQQKNVSSIQECADIAKNLNSNVFGLQAGGQCFTGNDEQRAVSLGINNSCDLLGGQFGNQVYTNPSSSCSYQMSSNELQCYAQNNPDLAINGITTSQQLQNHWSTNGCNERRNNNCPSKQQTSGFYNYKGCYNDTSIRAIPNYEGKVSSIDECKNIAETKTQNVFGLQNGGECFTGNNEDAAYQYGRNINRDSCPSLGGSFTNQIYARGQSFPPPVPPDPTLTIYNFNEGFKNIIDEEKSITNKKCFLLFLIFLVFLILLYFIYSTFYKKNKNK